MILRTLFSKAALSSDNERATISLLYSSIWPFRLVLVITKKYARFSDENKYFQTTLTPQNHCGNLDPSENETGGVSESLLVVPPKSPKNLKREQILSMLQPTYNLETGRMNASFPVGLAVGHNACPKLGGSRLVSRWYNPQISVEGTQSRSPGAETESNTHSA